MAKKGQTFKTYSFDLKKKAVELCIQGKSQSQVANELGILNRSQVQKWKTDFDRLGEAGLLDHRGRRTEYQDKDREIQYLTMQVEALKKCIAIMKKGGR
jgi:transposase-like protein